MKQRTLGKKPEYTIVERNGVFKVYDKNEHFRCSFATRQAAQAYINQRLGITPQPAAQAAQVAQVS